MSIKKTTVDTPSWRIVGWSCHQTTSSILSIAMTFAAYLAAGGYGIAVAMAGIIATYTRLFDAFIDPFLAMITDRVQTRFGRIRLLIVVGRSIQTLSIIALFFWGIGKGAVVYTVIYCFYCIGSSIGAIASHTGNPIITTNPKQRPLIFRWMLIFTTLISSFTSVYMSNVLYPKYKGLTIEAFQELALTVIAIMLIMEIIACISISHKDKPGAFPKKKDGSNVSFKDAWNLLKGNRAMQMYVIAGVSEKVAAEAYRQAAVITLVFGIIIGNYEFYGTFSMLRIIPNILVLLFGTRMACKSGTKKALTQWAFISMGLTVALTAFMMFMDPTQISVSIIPTIIFSVLFLAYGASSTVASACANAMVPDIVDYELARSGSFVPGTVGTMYSFIDEMVSSLSTTLVGFCLTAVGYVSVQPQPGDPSSPQIFGITMFLWMGMPFLGWLITIIVMKWYPLDSEKMIEVQKINKELRETTQTT